MKRILATSTAASMIAALLPLTASAEAKTPVLWYDFSQVDPYTVKDVSGSGNDGKIFNNLNIEYGAANFDGTDDYIEMPEGLLADADKATISICLKPGFEKTNLFAWNFGSSSSTGYMFLNPSRPTGSLRYGATKTDYNAEEELASGNGVNAGETACITVVIDGASSAIYRNGELEAENTLAIKPSDLGKTTQNWIAKSPYNDPYFKGMITDFRVYKDALTAGEVKAISDECLAEDKVTEDLRMTGIKSTVTSDLKLIKNLSSGESVVWTSSDESVISTEGKVTRPAAGEGDKLVTLTAAIGDTIKTFNVRVKELSSTAYELNVYNKKGVDIPKGQIGLFFEDINYAADGGIYAEQIENRSFEAQYAESKSGGYNKRYDGMWAWSEYPAGASDGKMELKTDSPLNANNPHYLEFTSGAKQTGFVNASYEGAAAEKGDVFNVSLYAKSAAYTGDIKVSLVKDGENFGETVISGVTDEWKKYEGTLNVTGDTRNAQIAVELTGSGTVDFDMISVFPGDAVDGLFRRDLADMLKDIKPGFLRFPGGCVIEGFDLANRYQWKNSVGPVEERIENWNRWDTHTTGYNHYNQTMGLGYYEYFKLCEYIGAKPLPVVSVGIACQYQSSETVDINSAEFEQYVQDALDLIEFANGDTKTEWGALRAEMGHPEPFGLEMIGIGNEQWETNKVNFQARYERFEKAIHEKYPDIKLIGTAGPSVQSDTYNTAWKWIREKMQQNDNFVYAVDEHYYMQPDWFYQNDNFYDNYPRDTKVFAGEYASRTQNLPNDRFANTLNTALSEAAFMTGLERNADVVEMASYAPLFARINYTQWSPDMIWFDDVDCYGTPSYYVQKMYANNAGDYTVKSALSDYYLNNSVYQTVSYDEKAQELIIKLVNRSDEEQFTQINISNGYSLTSDTAKTIILTGEQLSDTNSISEPKNVSEKEGTQKVTQSFVYEAPERSFTILRIPAQRNSVEDTEEDMVQRDLFLHYTFDGAENDMIKDKSGSGNNGRIHGNAVMTNGILTLDGTDDYIEMPRGILNGNDKYTIAMNVKTGNAKVNQFTWNFGNSSSNGYMFLNTSRPDGKLRYAITADTYSGESESASADGITVGVWSSIVVTIDGTKTVLYKDGIKVGEGTMSVLPSQLGDTRQNWIAKSPYEGDGYFKGELDDFRIYNHAMTDDEVLALQKEYAVPENNVNIPIDSDSKVYTAYYDSEARLADVDVDKAISGNFTEKVIAPEGGFAMVMVWNGIEPIKTVTEIR